MWLPLPTAQAYQGQALWVLKKISTQILLKKEGSIFSKNLDSLILATKGYCFLFCFSLSF